MLKQSHRPNICAALGPVNMRRLAQHVPVSGILGGVLLVVSQYATQSYMSDASTHKSLFPLNRGDIGGLTLAAAALFVAAGGGIG